MPIFHSLNINIYGVVDVNEKRARSCAKKFGVKKWFTDYHDLLKHNLDLVCVCTPNDTHATITIDAAQSGSNVLVEKPMATNLSDAQKMLEICNKSGVMLCVMHEYRMYSCVQEAKRRIQSGRIGRLVSMHVVAHDFVPLSWSKSTWFYQKWGLLEDLGPHIIDIINYLCDSPINDAKVFARDYIENMDCLNHIQSLLSFQNKAIVDLDISWITGAFELTLKILGTAGTLYIDVRNDHIFEIHGYSTPLEELYSNWNKLIKTVSSVLNQRYFKGPVFFHKIIIKKFIESIIKDTEPPITGKEAIEVMEIIELIKNRINNK